MSALLWACDGGNEDIVELLIDAEADLSAQDADGQTALHYGKLSTLRCDLRFQRVAEGARGLWLYGFCSAPTKRVDVRFMLTTLAAASPPTPKK